MKHKKLGFLHLMCGKQGRKGKRRLSIEFDVEGNRQAYMMGLSLRLLFVFVGVAVEIEKKQEIDYGTSVSQETTDDDSVQGP